MSKLIGIIAGSLRKESYSKKIGKLYCLCFIDECVVNVVELRNYVRKVE